MGKENPAYSCRLQPGWEKRKDILEMEFKETWQGSQNKSIRLKKKADYGGGSNWEGMTDLRALSALREKGGKKGKK